MANQQSATFQFSQIQSGTKWYDWSSSANWVNGVTPGSLGGTAAVTIPASSAGTSYDNVASLTVASLTEQTGAPAVEIASGDILTAGTLGSAGVIRIDANAKLFETGGAASGYITLNGANAVAELDGNPSGEFTFTAGDPSSVYLRQLTLGGSDTHAVQGFGTGDQIYLEEQGWKTVPAGPLSVTYKPSGTGATTGTLTITSGGTTVYKFTGFSGSTNTTYHASATTITDPQTGVSTQAIDLVVCFAEGTRIATPDGARPVEALRAGDLVIAVEAGQQRARHVRWVGHRRLDLAAHPRPERAAPIRFRTGALGDGLPCRDLLVSPDHALLIEERLVPAKLLLNGMTIIQERALPAISYYHVELDGHAILLAEGVAAESYLEAGHRGFFANGGATLELHPDLMARAAPQHGAACAPFAREASEVEPIWRALSERAHALGHVAPTRVVTFDPDLRLIADGVAVPARALAEGRLGFTIPAGTRSLRLASRVFVPAERTPYVDDWRRLGVAVSAIALRTTSGLQEIAPDHRSLVQGWHAAEREDSLLWRWTDGDAVLPLAWAEGGVLELRVHATGAYEAAEMAAEGRLAA